MNLPAVLPDQFLRCMKPADRKIFAPGQHTPEEAIATATVTVERQLQSFLVGLLRLRGIEPLWFRTDKRSRATIGWPDITFAVGGRACAWEAKLPGEIPRPEQIDVHNRMKANGWAVSVVSTVDQARRLLDELGSLPAVTL